MKEKDRNHPSISLIFHPEEVEGGDLSPISESPDVMSSARVSCY